jgi:serine/threonine-protein kinase RsbW
VSGLVTVSVPARPEYVRVLRAVAAGVAARLDFTFDRIEDLRIAVDEACGTILGLPDATTVTLQMTSDDTGAEIVVSSDAGVAAGGWPPPDVDQTLSWRVLTGLVQEVGFDRTDRGPAIRLQFRRKEF